MKHILDISRKFAIDGIPFNMSPVGSGHINDSYLVSTSPEEAPDYVLQRINDGIFRDIPGLMKNIGIVTQHIGLLLKREPQHYENLQVLELIPTLLGQSFYTDPDGNCWRMYFHIPGSHSYDRVPEPAFAYEGGRAFGQFQALTAGVDPGTLAITIPRFHDITWRLEQFDEAIKQDIANRVSRITDEIHFVRERAQEMHTIQLLSEQGKLPVRITHNDTKFNNILFDKTDRAICIVDLDTVMPGTVLYDFGDAIRTGANTADEDETDLGRVDLDLALFEAYSRGFLETAGDMLTTVELDHLAFSAKFMTYLIGLRFLTDYMNGDTYFKIRYPEHNLQRASVQFRMLSRMEKQTGEMERIIKSNHS